jgi:hypothetical protein
MLERSDTLVIGMELRVGTKLFGFCRVFAFVMVVREVMHCEFVYHSTNQLSVFRTADMVHHGNFASQSSFDFIRSIASFLTVSLKITFVFSPSKKTLSRPCYI